MSRPVPTMLVGAALVVLVDQVSKWLALETLTDPDRTIDLFWTFRLRVIYNTGTAFSLTSDTGPVVTVIAVAVVGYLLVAGRRQATPAALVCYSAIIGGTIGNIADRAFRDGDGVLGGPVIDFVDPQWFPVFNVADAALVLGIGALLVVSFRDERAGADAAGRVGNGA